MIVTRDRQERQPLLSSENEGPINREPPPGGDFAELAQE